MSVSRKIFIHFDIQLCRLGKCFGVFCVTASASKSIVRRCSVNFKQMRIIMERPKLRIKVSKDLHHQRHRYKFQKRGMVEKLQLNLEVWEWSPPATYKGLKSKPPPAGGKIFTCFYKITQFQDHFKRHSGHFYFKNFIVKPR